MLSVIPAGFAVVFAPDQNYIMVAIASRFGNDTFQLFQAFFIVFFVHLCAEIVVSEPDAARPAKRFPCSVISGTIGFKVPIIAVTDISANIDISYINITGKNTDAKRVITIFLTYSPCLKPGDSTL